MDLRPGIARARTRAAAYLDSLLLPELGFGIHRESHWEGGRDVPGMLLPGTYNAAACRFLIGSWRTLDPEDVGALADFLSSHQVEDGAFRVPGMTEDTLYYPDFEYDDLHVTNYCLGVLDLLGRKPPRPLRFAERYANPEALDEWLDRRDPGSPWTEGNYLVNVGSLLAWLAREGHPGAPAAFLRLLDWHDEHQDPATGFWASPGTDPLSGMAGAAHDLHLYSLARRRVPRYETIIDTCLGLIPGPATTACLDVDVVDILASLHSYGYRRKDIESYLEDKGGEILAVQNPDGGFPDAFEGERTFDGWETYREPQGISNAFATWFRMASIAMAAWVLYPETRPLWRFRGTIGIGYFPVSPEDPAPAWLEPGRERYSRFLVKGRRDAGNPARGPDFPEPRSGPAGSPESGTGSGEDGTAVPRSLADAVVGRLRSAPPGALARAAGPCRFEFPGAGILDLVIDAEGVREAAAGTESPPGLTFIVSPEDLERILSGGLGATAAYMKKKLRIRGDISRALALQAALKAR